MAFIRELLDEAVSSCFVASTCHTRQQAQWPSFAISDFCMIRRIHLGMEDSGNHLSNGSALAQKKLNSAGRRWIGECNAQATVIDLQEHLLRRYLLTSKKSPILFTHQLDNWWVPASIQCWSLGKRKNDSKQWIAFLYNFGTTKQDKSVESVSASLVRSSWA